MTDQPLNSASSSSSSSSDDDSLVFEGVVDKERDIDNYESSDSNEESKSSTTKKDVLPTSKSEKSGGKRRGKGEANGNEDKKRKKKRHRKRSSSNTSDSESDSDSSDDEEEIQVSFLFCDMDSEKHFYGIKTLLGFEPLHFPHSSQLTDCIVDNVEIGTLITTENDPDHNVYAFASLLNVGTIKGNSRMYGSRPCISKLIKMCIEHCPSEYEAQMTKLLSEENRNSKALGLLLHGRMVNVPLTIVDALHQQLVQDMQWAAKGGGDDKKKEPRQEFSFDKFLLMVPCYRDQTTHSLYYKYTEDEIFASHADFHFEVDLTSRMPPSGMREATSYNLCTVMILDPKAYHKSLKEAAKLSEPVPGIGK